MTDDPRQRELPGDARKTALLALAPTAQDGELLGLVLEGFEAIEQMEFGELEPIGVASPAGRP